LAISELVATTQNNFIMKKLKLLVAGLLITLMASSQAGQINQINIVNFTVKSTLPGTVDSWLSTPGALLLTAQKVPGSQVREPMMVLQIRSGSAIICGNTTATPKRIDPFDVRVFNTTDLTGMLGNCQELKPGTYTICVQFFNIDKVAISREVCKDFKVEDAAVEYSPPTLITPDNDKKFTAQELQTVVMFRWTPLVPKPKEPVTYRLRVWQLMQGQNATTAMRTNQPIVTKDVDNITQATVSGIYTGPCKPPYLCDFIWNVQALNRSGKPIGNNNGTSEPYTFGLADEKSKGPDNVFPEDKKGLSPDEAKREVIFRWTPLVPKPKEPVIYRIKVWQLMDGQNSTQAMRSNQPIVTKDVDNLTQVAVSGIYTGPCKPPYLCDYIWSVEAITRNAGQPQQTIGTSTPTGFYVTDENSKGLDNVFPEDQKKVSKKDMLKPVMFRWTAIVPKPRETVTYRLKVWQLMDGQNSTQAMRTNQPIVTKDVDNLTQVAVSGIYTGPCKPPFLCDFVWSVEAITKNAGQTGQTIGTSTATVFSVTDENSKGPDNVFPEDQKKFSPKDMASPVLFRWTAIVPKPRESVTYRLKVWQLMDGQNSTQAMRTNQPIVVKDVDNITEASVSNIYTGPCKPPYLCDYIWSVEAITKNAGQPEQTIGTSTATAFSVTNENSKGPDNAFPEDQKKFSPKDMASPVLFRWTPIVPKPQEPAIYRLKVWQLMQGQNGTQAMRTNQPIVTKDVDNITEVSVSNIYTGPCRPPYLCDFIWNVQVVTRDGTNGAESEPTTFSITEKNTNGLANVFPEDKKQFQPEGTKGVRFSWTPLAPKPNAPVTYRVRIWQLMEGQNGLQAMRSNKPIVTKDVDNITESVIENFYTGPCKPPYLCDYIWNVQALDKQGNPIGNNSGMSEPWSFSVSSAGCGTNTDNVKVSCGPIVQGIQTYTVSITFSNIIPTAGGQQCTTQMNTITSSTGTISSIATLPVTIPIGGTSAAVNFSYTPTVASATTASFSYQGIWNDGNNNTSNFTNNTVVLPVCICDFCKVPKYNAGNPTTAVTGNTLNIVHPIVLTLPPGVSILGSKAEITGFERYVGDDCMPCDKNATQWGNFINGTSGAVNGAFASATTPVTGNTHHTIYFTGPAATPFNLNISVPPLSNLSCCCDKIVVTIRYTFIFKDKNGECRYCSQVYKYNYQRGTCPANPIGIDPNQSPK
jgi:hypothetical protein